MRAVISNTQNGDPLPMARIDDDVPCDRSSPELTDLLASLQALVSPNFRESLQSLPSPQQREKLLGQLQDALEMTTNLVLRNHRQESCLPTPTINSLTHVYPLLIREIEIWHREAIKKMTNKFPDHCWSSNRRNSCAVDVQPLGIPLAPSLWEPMQRLLVDFGAKCDPLPPRTSSDTSTTGCTASNLVSCRDVQNVGEPHCLPKQCRFSKYSVDVKAFFRHANGTRNFLPPAGVPEPLWKQVNVTLDRRQAVRGHYELAVDERYPFLIQYSPVHEKVKISFRYAAKYDCSLNDGACAGRLRGCDVNFEEKVDLWFNTLLRQMKPVDKKCKKQIMKLKRRRSRNSNRQPRRRSRSAARRNQVPSIPNRCRYWKKTARITSRQWGQVMERARERGAVVEDNRATFRSPDHVTSFFRNRCSIEEPRAALQNLSKRMGRKRIIYAVKMLVSDDIPFVIDRMGSGKIRFQFFTKFNPIGTRQN